MSRPLGAEIKQGLLVPRSERLIIRSRGLRWPKFLGTGDKSMWVLTRQKDGEHVTHSKQWPCHPSQSRQDREHIQAPDRNGPFRHSDTATSKAQHKPQCLKEPSWSGCGVWKTQFGTLWKKAIGTNKSTQWLVGCIEVWRQAGSEFLSQVTFRVEEN